MIPLLGEKKYIKIVAHLKKYGTKNKNTASLYSNGKRRGRNNDYELLSPVG